MASPEQVIREFVQMALHAADDEILIAELTRRAYRVVGDVKRVQELYADKPVRNAEPEEKWLEVWERLILADNAKRDYIALLELTKAVRALYLLLEPPSVQERRLNGE